MTEVIPAILEKDYPEIERKIRLVESYVNWVQIDIADNTLVANTTFLDPESYSTIIHLGGGQARPPRDHLNLELHMMVKDPLKYFDSFKKAGFKRFIAHVEGHGVEDFIVKCQENDVEVGLAIDGPTQIEKVFPYIEDIDVVLVMAIEAGASGRPFREDTISKIQTLHSKFFDLAIAVDGAMNLENARRVVAAGANRINSNSYIFKSPDIKGAIESLKNIV